MFEGKPPIASGANGSNHGDSVNENLCALNWADVVARLAAARDLRRELDSHDDAALASFDAECAQHLASHHGKSPEELATINSKHGVNPDALANGKDVCAINGRRADRGDTADRGNT